MSNITYNGTTIPQQKGADLLGQLMNSGCEVQYICMSGSCGTCRVNITSGMEHLSNKAGMENMHGCKDGERLACQAICRGTGDIVVEQK